ncbi:MAG TPA: hypothetical protein PKZ76_16275 [Xanthomonadaceae bacterium]|nr:hypothetical protein [Xanthomonadaceae bacterium]
MTEKEKGATPFESAPQGDNSTSNYTVQTPAQRQLPLTWRPEKPPRFRGKTRRRTRADAITRKRGELGRIAPELAGSLLMLAVVVLLAWGAQ